MTGLATDGKLDKAETEHCSFNIELKFYNLLIDI